MANRWEVKGSFRRKPEGSFHGPISGIKPITKADRKYSVGVLAGDMLTNLRDNDRFEIW